MKKAIVLLSIICSITYSKEMPRKYNDAATRKLQNLVENVELWAGIAKPAFLNEVEKLILEGANPNVKDQLDMTLMILLMRTPNPRIQLFTLDMPLLEKTFKVVLENGADVTELTSGPLFPDNILDATPAMIQMLIDHMPIKNSIQQRLKREAKTKIIQSVKEYLEHETKTVALRKRKIEAYARGKDVDPQLESARAHVLEQSEKEVDRLRKILDLLEEPATKTHPKLRVNVKDGIVKSDDQRAEHSQSKK